MVADEETGALGDHSGSINQIISHLNLNAGSGYHPLPPAGARLVWVKASATFQSASQYLHRPLFRIDLPPTAQATQPRRNRNHAAVTPKDGARQQYVVGNGYAPVDGWAAEQS